MLEVTQLSASYGAIKALENVSVHVAGSEIVCLLGSNGAGKTTLLNTISGVVPAQQGRIRFKGEDITGKPIDQIVAMGLVQVPEGREIFGNLNTLDNLQLGAWTRRKDPRWKTQLETVFELFPRLKERSTQLAGTLSGGEQQMLMIGRALMASPSMIMFDEPSLGLSPLLVSLVFETIEKIHQQGITVLLVEQNARMALRRSRRGYILENGEVKLQGESEALMNNPLVKEAYLGSGT
jgi:branched-chain amino acid transport system ATP-binding protein